MTLFSTLKKNSRLALGENWGRAILALLARACLGAVLSAALWITSSTLLGPMFQVPTMDPPAGFSVALAAGFGRRFGVLGVFVLINLLFTAPMQLGVYYWYRTLVHGKSLPVGGVFHFFQSPRRLLRSVWFSINLQVRALLWGLLFFLLPAGLHGVSLWMISASGERGVLLLATMGYCLSALLLVFAGVLFTVFMNRYILAAYLLCEDQDIGVMEALRTSITYTKGYRFRFFLFGLTFAGWILLSLLTLGLGFIYTGPYLFTAYAMYGRYIIEKNRYIPPNDTREFVVEEASASEPQEDAAN